MAVKGFRGEYLQRGKDERALQQGRVIYGHFTASVNLVPLIKTQAKYLGRHLILECYGCSYDILNDVEGLRKLLISAAKKAGATVLGDVFHKYTPHGVSGVVVIAESHLSIHTWPEYGYAAIDIYTCGDIDLEIIKEEVIKYLKPAFYMKLLVNRGIPIDSQQLD